MIEDREAEAKSKKLQQDLEAVYVDQFWRPCTSKNMLQQWLKTYLNVDLPDHTTSQFSNSNPMDFIWAVYHSALTGDKNSTSHVVAAARNSAKCLKEGTLVATPTGPVEIQNLKFGDKVYDEYGKPVNVTEVHNQGVQECVDLVFGGTVMATCTPNHKWSTYEIRTPEVFRDRMVSEFYNGVKVKRVELNLPLGNKHEPLAYALGAFLGDGCSTLTGLQISSKNDLIPSKIAKMFNTTFTKLKGNYTYIIRAPKRGVKHHFSDFYENNIRGRKAHEKLCDINEIKTWDRESLLAFVAGLIDTDGSVFIPQKKDTQVFISFGMQALPVVEAFRYAVNALWQVDLKMRVSKSNHYVNGPFYYVVLNSIYHCKRILKELDPHIVTPSKKYKPEYDLLKPRNFNPAGFGVRTRPAGKHQCWDITVDSATSLYCLQNGMVTHNTISAAIIEFLMMVHFGRDIVHIAAEVQQSSACIDYLDRFLNIPLVQSYMNSDNRRQKILKGMPTNPNKVVGYSKLRVVTATKKGANSSRASVLVFDEVDMIEREILSEAAMIADPDRTGKPPIFIYLSSRKSAVGPIQEKIDQAEMPGSRIKLHKWNVIEWMKPCPPEVHKPNKPVTLHLHPETLQVLTQEKFDRLRAQEQDVYDAIPAFEGCVTCPVFTVCRTDAIKQKSATPRLRDKEFYADLMVQVNAPETIIAQIINLKPESSGIVFNRFDKAVHLGDYSACWKFAFNDTVDNRTVTKKEFVSRLRTAGWRLHCGVDFGYIDPAVGMLVAYHKPTGKLLVLHTEYETGISTPDWLMHIKKEIYEPYGFDMLCPDIGERDSPAIAAQLGMPSLNDKPRRIETGVSWIRSRLWNVATQSSLFMILDDPMCKGQSFLVKSMEQWQYMKTSLGYDFSKFMDDDNTHAIDSCRYATAPFISSQQAIVSASQGQYAEKDKTYLDIKAEIDAHYLDKYGIDLNGKEKEDKMINTGNIIISF